MEGLERYNTDIGIDIPEEAEKDITTDMQDLDKAGLDPEKNLGELIESVILEIPKFLQFDETQEFAPSMEVQAELLNDYFSEVKEFNYDVWKELDVDERIELLQGLENEAAVVSLRDPIKVMYEDLPDSYGYFSGDKIVISKEVLADNSYENYKENIDTVLHEGRHAYQAYNLNVRQVEKNNVLLESWDINDNILGYDNGYRSDPYYAEVGFLDYYTQPVEVDARAFAATVIDRLGI